MQLELPRVSRILYAFLIPTSIIATCPAHRSLIDFSNTRWPVKPMEVLVMWYPKLFAYLCSNILLSIFFEHFKFKQVTTFVERQNKSQIVHLCLFTVSRWSRNWKAWVRFRPPPSTLSKLQAHHSAPFCAEWCSNAHGVLTWHLYA